MTKIPTEHQEQVMLFAWSARIPALKLMHAIPNGGKRDIRTAAMLKAEGVKPGVPDIFLPVPRGGFHGLYIEMKRRKGGTVTPEQAAWIKALCEKGYCCAICHGWEAARDEILDYLQGDEAHGHDTAAASGAGARHAKAQ